MTSIPVRPSLADVSALPHVALTPAELDDVELALAGAVPVAGVAVGAATPAAQHGIGDGVVLTDAESTRSRGSTSTRWSPTRRVAWSGSAVR